MKSAYFISSVLIGTMLGVVPVFGADEIILNSGKTLRGRITSETESVWKIKVGNKMLLSVSKDDVADVIRDTPPPPPPPVPAKTVQTEPEKPVETPAQVAATEEVLPPSDAAVDANDPEPALPLPEGATRKNSEVGSARVSITFLQNTYDVTGKTLDEVVASITDPRTGIGFPGRLKKRPSRTEWRVKWYGKPNATGTAWEELVIGSTVTTTQPVWKFKGDMPVIQENRWNVFARQRANVEAKHIAIIEETLQTFALSASNIEAENETALRAQTAQLLSEIRGRGDNRRRGLDRRIEEPRPNYLARRKMLVKPQP